MRRERDRVIQLGEFRTWGYDRKGWSKRTREKYGNTAALVDRWLQEHRNGRQLAKANAKDLQAFIKSRPPSARNRNNIRQSLVAYFAWLVDIGARPDNPALAGLNRYREPQLLPKALDEEEWRRIPSVLPLFTPMERLIILLMLYGGLRKGEVRTLEWSSVEESGDYIRFLGKGSKERVIPLHPEVRAALRAWKPQCQDPRWIFPSTRREGKPISETWLRHVIDRLGEVTALPTLHPHKLRHTFATRLIELGTELTTVQAAMGHADPKTTVRYVKTRDVRIADAIRQLDFAK